MPVIDLFGRQLGIKFLKALPTARSFIMNAHSKSKTPRPYWWEAHRQALHAHKTEYIDPVTGEEIKTEIAHLQRGDCCGKECRHCPYNYKMVGKVKPESQSCA